MASTLSDLAPPLVLACGSCNRRGRYQVSRLIARFGSSATLQAVRDTLAAERRWRRDPRSYQGNAYTRRCQARWQDYRVPPTARPDDQRLALGLGAVWRIDEWLPGREAIAQELAHVSRLTLAHRVFEAAVALDPHAPITLRQSSHFMREIHPLYRDLDPHGRGPHNDTHRVGPLPKALTRPRR